VSLESQLLAWVKSKGRTIVQQVAVKNVDLNALTASLVSCIQSAMPPALASGFTASANVSRGGDGTASISLEFENKTRVGFTKPVYDIYGLFTQGWDYDPAIAPYGIWHGRRVRARPSYVGQAFVQSGVDAWKASLPSGVEADVQIVNRLYT